MVSRFPPHDDVLAAVGALNKKYQTEPKLADPRGGRPIVNDAEAVAVWLSEYLRLRVELGSTHEAAKQRMIAAIDRVLGKPAPGPVPPAAGQGPGGFPPQDQAVDAVEALKAKYLSDPLLAGPRGDVPIVNDSQAAGVWVSEYVRIRVQSPTLSHDDAVRAVLAAIDRVLAPPPPTLSVKPKPVPAGAAAGIKGPVRPDGHAFRGPDGAIWKWRGATAFTALQDWLAGDQAKLDRYAAWTRALGVNLWRVLGMWPRGTDFDPRQHGLSYYDGLLAFSRWLASQGLYVQVVLITDQVDSLRWPSTSSSSTCGEASTSCGANRMCSSSS